MRGFPYMEPETTEGLMKLKQTDNLMNACLDSQAQWQDQIVP